jgi:cell division protein FtsB
MDILNILDQLKQKGLDVVQVELLKNAYELQNRNLEQLKANNDALRESHDLLKEKIANLEQENAALRTQLKSLPRIQARDEISEIAKDILRECVKKDAVKLNSAEMARSLSSTYTRMQVETGIGELSNEGHILQSRALSGFGEGVDYRLTQTGKEFAIALDEKK